MNNLTKKQLRGLFTTIEINLLLWLVVCGAIWESTAIENHTKHIAAAAFVLAAILQHWAYYNLYRRAKGSDKKGNAEHPKPLVGE